jgi:Ca2+-binding EF-hand superfamily protein
MFDSDGDGRITIDEFRSIFHQSDKGMNDTSMDQIWMEILEDIDADHDGAIDFKEFCDTMEKVAKHRITRLRD